MNLRETSAAPGPTAVMAEDETLLADELADLLQTLWPQLRIVARAADGLPLSMRSTRMRRTWRFWTSTCRC